MNTILTVSACWVLFILLHVEATTYVDLGSVLARLSVLEEKQAFSEKRIAALEMENKISQKRIVVLEKYKKLFERRVAALERKNALFNRRNDVLDIEKKLYAQDVALQTDKILLNKTSTTNAYDKKLSDRKVFPLEKDKILADTTIPTLRINYAVPPNPNGKEDRHYVAVEITNRSTSVLQSEHRRFVAEGTVAFSAMKSASQQNMGLHQNIMFETVLTNEGGGYHPNHGVFIAPQTGVYVISSTIMTFPNWEVHAVIVHNGNVVARIYGHGDSGLQDQGSQTIVIKMNAGDEVAVQNFDLLDDTIFGSLYSSFSGFLL